MKRRALWSWILAGVVALVAAALAWRTPAARVETAAVIRGTFVRAVTDDGITRVRDRYQIDATVGGTLLRIGVHEGDAVEAGQVVATILPSSPQLLDPRTRAELAARRDAAQALLARSRALQREADSGVQQAEIDLRRFRELASSGYVSPAEHDKAALALDRARRDADAARYGAEAAAHDLAEANAALGRTRGDDPGAAWPLRSPVGGRVLAVLQESGGPVALGAHVLEVGDVSRLEAVVDVLTDEATAIQPQAPVTLTAGEGVRLAGRVRTIEPAARTKVSALGIEEQRVNVVVDLLPNPAQLGKVGDGYRVDAQIEVERIDEAIQVPVAALFRSGLQWAVYGVEGGRVHLRPVSLGARSQDMAVVTRGVEPGDEVVLYPPDTLRDGGRVIRLGAGH